MVIDAFINGIGLQVGIIVSILLVIYSTKRLINGIRTFNFYNKKYKYRGIMGELATYILILLILSNMPLLNIIFKIFYVLIRNIILTIMYEVTGVDYKNV